MGGREISPEDLMNPPPTRDLLWQITHKNIGQNTLSVNQSGFLRAQALKQGGKERVGFRERRTEEIRIYGHNLVYCPLAVLLMQNCRK